MTRARSPAPPRLGLLWWTAAVASIAAPLALLVTARGEAAVLSRYQGELAELLRTGSEHRRGSLPAVLAIDGAAAPTASAPAGPVVFAVTSVFSATEIERYRRKSASEGEFAQALQPPATLAADVTPDAIAVHWELPDGVGPVLERLADLPLLRLRFRVYRWREGDEPKLLTTLDGHRTAFQDRDLPVGRERFFYCVATVIEGTIGDLPTLIESKRSSVITVETVENFTLEVIESEADLVRLGLRATVDGRVLDRVLDVALGQPIVPAVSAETPEPLARRLDTGLTLTGVRLVEGNEQRTRSRPEFLPDGRRKLDPATGLPTYRSETLSVPTRTLELTCRERSGAIRTFTSPAPN